MPEHPQRDHTGGDWPDLDFEKLADEAVQGYDISWHEPTKPHLWLAELLSEDTGQVVGRTLLFSRADAEMALKAHWRIVRYVRADLALHGPAPHPERS